MFAFIETNNATHIAIAIPLEGADKTIPALVAMLENNAVFVQKGYDTLETRKPKMTIELDSEIEVKGRESTLSIRIPGSTSVIDDSFVLETPEVRISNQKALAQKDAEISRLRTELAHVKQQFTDLQERINAAAESDD
jgi:hypothetical protein